MDMLSWLAEQRIQEAMRDGQFNNLPGHGKPLELEDLSGVPEELRMSFKILKNAGLLPEELALRAECASLESLLAACISSGEATSGERHSLEKKLSVRRLQLQELLRQRGLDNNPSFMDYSGKISERLLGED